MFISCLKATRALHFSSASGPLLERPAIFQWLIASLYRAFNSFARSSHPGTLNFEGFRFPIISLSLLCIAFDINVNKSLSLYLGPCPCWPTAVPQLPHLAYLSNVWYNRRFNPTSSNFQFMSLVFCPSMLWVIGSWSEFSVSVIAQWSEHASPWRVRQPTVDSNWTSDIATRCALIKVCIEEDVRRTRCVQSKMCVEKGVRRAKGARCVKIKMCSEQGVCRPSCSESKVRVVQGVRCKMRTVWWMCVSSFFCYRYTSTPWLWCISFGEIMAFN